MLAMTCVRVLLLVTLTCHTQAQGDCPMLQVSAATILDPPDGTFSVGHKVNVSCPQGHAFNQASHAGAPYVILVCLSNGWNTTQTPSCAEHYVPAREGPQCPQLAESDILTDVGNRTLVYGNGTEYGTIYRYYCYTGYYLVPMTPFTQCKNAVWTNLPNNLTQPMCQRIQCRLPAVPSILTLVPTTPSPAPTMYIDYGALVTVSCTTGYEIQGEDIINCTADGSLSSTPACQDIDECDSSAPCEQICYNTRGSFRCDCYHGYNLTDDQLTCQDVDECALIPNLCPQGTCVNLVGGYQCTCDGDAGYILYTFDGEEGYNIPESEKLFDSVNNTFRINHTCVLRQCEFSNTFPNGDLLRYQTHYHVGDILEFHCQIGYKLSGSRLIQCRTNGTWSADIPVCQEAFCILPMDENQTNGLPPTYLNSSTELVLPLGTRVAYGVSVLVSCQDYGQTNRTILRCFYDRENDEHRILTTSCLVVTCPPASGVGVGSGHLELVNGTANQYGAVYDIVCEDGAVFTGTTPLSPNNQTVCGMDGVWQLGDAYCLGRQCNDPGTPYGGTQVVDGDYTLGSTLYYNCVTPGFIPYPNLTYTCTRVGDMAVWVNVDNSTITCVDAEPPVLTCPIDQFVVIGTWLTNSTPTVTDNSGGLVHIFYSFEAVTPIIGVEPDTPPYPPYRIQENTIVTITANTMNEDKIAPAATCTFIVTVEPLVCEPLIMENAFIACGSQACSFICLDGFIFWDGESTTTSVQDVTCEYDGHTQPQFPLIGVCAIAAVSSVVSLYFDIGVSASSTNVTMKCVTDFLDALIPNNGSCFTGSQVIVQRASTTHRSNGYVVRYNASITDQDGKVTRIQTCLDTLETKVNGFEFNSSVEITDCGSFFLSEFTISVQPIRSVCPPGQVDFQGNCYPCLPGTFLNDSGVPFCQLCPSDEYSETLGALECMPCDSGTVPQLIAGRSEQDCIECPDICLNGGTCDEASFTCHCPLSYSGVFCQNRLDPCGSNPCRAGGTCNVAQGIFFCICNTGYMGVMCENRDFCATMDCGTNGVCVETDTGAVCICRNGVTGNRCQMTGDACTLDPCSINTIECVLHGDYRRTCMCQPGWTGVNCDIDIDECVSMPCVNGATCEDGVNGYTCMCDTGYTGPDCSVPNSCTGPLPDSCPRCVEDYTQGDRICVCPDGYDRASNADFSACVEQAPCAAPTPVCMNGGTCTPLGTVPGGYMCTCTAGWQGENCQVSVNECSSNPCGEGGTCIDQHNAYVCQCLDAVTDQDFYFGQLCVAGCDADPCDTVGTLVSGCISLLNDYICMCDVGYTGKDCEVTIDYCETVLCLNGGTCVDGVTSYTCICPLGWTGTLCEDVIPMCTETSCQQQAPCYNLLNDYFCLCENLINEDCDVRVSRCDDPNTCYNNARCEEIDLANDIITCICESGFADPVSLCFFDMDPCKDVCKKNRKCTTPLGDYLCQQPAGDPVEIMFSYVQPSTRWTNISIFLPCSGDCQQIQSDLQEEFGIVRFLGTAPSIDPETVKNVTFLLSAVAFLEQLRQVQTIMEQWTLVIASVSLFETIYGSITPAQGPRAGGTLLTLRGYNIPQDAIPFIGTYPCLPTQMNTIFVTCLTGKATAEADIDVQLPVRVHSEGNFTDTLFSSIYRGDPVITLVEPLTEIESGGTTITISGTNVEFIHTAVLFTTVVSIETGFSRTYTTSCDVGEAITCETANITDFKDSIRQKRDLLRHYLHKRNRRQTPRIRTVNEDEDVIIYIGMELDGVQDFRNLTANPNTTRFGVITAYRDPTIKRFNGGVLVFTSTWPVSDRQIEIKGEGLAPEIVRVSDLDIRVGVAMCPVIPRLQFFNMLVCKPPLQRPEVSPGVRSADGMIPVNVRIGNLYYDIGNMVFIQTVWEYLPFRYGIIAAIVGVIIIVIAALIYIFKFRRPRLFRRWREYHSLPRSDYVGPGIRYARSSQHTISDRLTHRRRSFGDDSYQI